MLTPNDLLDYYNKEYIKKELIELEKSIDDHLYSFYIDKDTRIPGFEIDKLKSPVEKILTDMYDMCGWTIWFEPLEDKNKYLLYIKQKQENKLDISSLKLKQSYRL